ncbi:MAG TPA: polysaccharide deacetylase family protein [Bryobacteraceae bacterium]|nr:polysaccharide deacetylase family protein [Bryobacteraceae bacterium]
MRYELSAPLTRRSVIGGALSASILGAQVQEKTVVLTLDDAVKSHRTFAGPLLKGLGHSATFFVTHRFMADTANFMSWQDVGELHRMGFEIGNHSWTHPNFSIPRVAARMAGELALVENELKRVQVPRPVSFAYSGNGFGPEAVQSLLKLGYRFARRGGMPEAPYGKLAVGATYDPRKHHRLLIPTTGDAYPDWTFEHFQEVISHARTGQLVVLQFHGVPDISHPWVHTPPEQFERYMRHLKQENYRVIALRDLESYLPGKDPDDPLVHTRSPAPKAELALPVEMESTRAHLSSWLPNMIHDHKYSAAEATDVAGISAAEVEKQIAAIPRPATRARLRPYPGGRPLRVGFRDGAIDPMRGTKVSVFLPWDPSSYAVIDLPEAIFSNLGLLFLAHTHVPTIWNERNVIIENSDWTVTNSGLESKWELPNGVAFGAIVQPIEDRVEMELWLRNGTAETLSKLRTQICVLLKEAAGFNETTNDNKTYSKEMASVRDSRSQRSILTQWERCGRTWGNAQCPCMHSDPVLPDCPSGETVRVRGKLWFG